jgi:hypothetical protein
MKQKQIVLLVAIITTCFSVASEAALLNRGGGLIYDDILNVTWLQDANYAVTSGYVANNLKDDGRFSFNNVLADGRMGRNAASTWVNQLDFRGYNDWRLPMMGPVNGTNFQLIVTRDGSTDRGWNITSPNAEMSHMFYVNLMNEGQFDTDGNPTGCGGNCLTNTGPFENLQSFLYWYGNDFMVTQAIFDTQIGLQNAFRNPEEEFFTWAVRSGDVTVVPVPSALWLFASGLFGLFSWKRKQLR